MGEVRLMTRRIFDEDFWTETPTCCTSGGSCASAWLVRDSSSIWARFWSKPRSKVAVMMESPLLVELEDI